MPGTERDDRLAALRLRWGRTHDIGQVQGELWALKLDGTGEPIGPAGTPDDLDAMIGDAETGG